ncbi:TetR/AcrR family transcriptional regulator [Actinomadura sp. DC4]|uniref:TetR/AcrR family transcriptional regulator n=1 Tax=Actinomadura sp. DC4 TaxID=3055069 RepID=UPI0025B01F6B|nr:TetR/AcrR family transcriptional regulator [Actinomadura sp. DC4]MDN3356781.1 TetR/AcrR family transcriptional regulator [Actinomadura sp. DC4]
MNRAAGSNRPTPGRPRTPRLGRPPLVDRQSIVRAAIGVGFGAITMTAVAEHLGIKHSTLYRYFANRDELITAAVDLAVAEASWPEPEGDWRNVLNEHTWATFRLLDANPGLATQIGSLRIDSAAYGAVSHRAVTALLDLGFGAEEAILAHDLVHEQVLMFFTAGQRQGDAVGDIERTAELRRAMLEDALPDVDPRLRDALTHVVQGPPADWFARKLAVILDGIAAFAPS